MRVLSYKYKESTHFDCCLVKRVQRITVLKVYECHPLVNTYTIRVNCCATIRGGLTESTCGVPCSIKFSLNHFL